MSRSLSRRAVLGAAIAIPVTALLPRVASAGITVPFSPNPRPLGRGGVPGVGAGLLGVGGVGGLGPGAVPSLELGNPGAGGGPPQPYPPPVRRSTASPRRGRFRARCASRSCSGPQKRGSAR